MIKYTKYLILALITGITACSDHDNSGNNGDMATIQYSVTLTDVALNKKGSSETLTINGLPVRSATLTQD